MDHSDDQETMLCKLVSLFVVMVALIVPEAVFCVVVYECWQMTHSINDALLMLAVVPIASLLGIALTAPLWVPFANGVMSVFGMACKIVGTVGSPRLRPPF